MLLVLLLLLLRPLLTNQLTHQPTNYLTNTPTPTPTPTIATAAAAAITTTTTTSPLQPHSTERICGPGVGAVALQASQGVRLGQGQEARETTGLLKRRGGLLGVLT